MSGIELVVALYNEDPSWIRNAAPGLRITVYCKGDQTFEGSIRLPNIGREAHSYLHHIIERWDSLADYTFFAQGRPFDHCPHLHFILRKSVNAEVELPDFQWLGFIIDWDDPDGSNLFKDWSKNEDGRALQMRDFSRQLWGDTGPERWIFYPGAHFGISRELIRQRPLAFYENALRVAETFPDAAHCFERSWDRVFGVEGVPPELCEQGLPLYLKKIRKLDEEHKADD